MPYSIKKEKCKQSDGDSGTYRLRYTDKKGKKHSSCHSSKKSAQGTISAIEMRKESDMSKNSFVESDHIMEIREFIRLSLMQEGKRAGKIEPNNLLEKAIDRVLREASSSLASDAQTKAADLELAIVDAINTGKPEMYQTLSKAIASELEKMGITGNASKPPKSQISKKWKDYGGTDTTPKTDILVGSSKISLKMGSSQFMSGESGEARATLLAALERSGLDKKIAQAALDSVNNLQKNVKYSAYVTDIRKMPGYKSVESDVQVPGKASKEVKMLMTQEAAQAAFEKDLLSVLDPNKNLGLKNAFILEAMDGMIKFNNSAGTANYLLAVAGESTFYDETKGLAALGKKGEKSIPSFMHINVIDESLAAKYANKVSIIVKFKTRSSGSSDVVGIMLKESDDFKKKLKEILSKKNEAQSFQKSMLLIREGMWDDLKDMVGSSWKTIKSLWQTFVAKVDKAISDFTDAVNKFVEEGAESLLDFLGEVEVVAESSTINWFSE